MRSFAASSRLWIRFDQLNSPFGMATRILIEGVSIAWIWNGVLGRYPFTFQASSPLTWLGTGRHG
jgi:hypothetical protein